MGVLDALQVQLETAHTRLLAWLLNPNGDHGLGSAALEGFCKTVIGRVPSLTGATVETERPELASRGDITIQTSKYYIVVENKINHAAFKTAQLIQHAKGARHRCRDNGRKPWVVLIVPNEKWLGCPELPKHAIGCETVRLDWGRISRILEVAAADAPRGSSGRAFIPVYVDFIEREILRMWKGFNENFLEDEVVKAAAVYASKKVGIEDTFESFTEAVNRGIHAARRDQRSKSQGLEPLGDQHILCSRVWRLDKKGIDRLRLGIWVYPGALARRSIELWVEMWVYTPTLVKAGVKAGWRKREAARRQFGGGAYPDPDQDNIYIATKVPQSVWLAHSKGNADRAVAEVTKLVSRYWDQYDKLATKRNS